MKHFLKKVAFLGLGATFGTAFVQAQDSSPKAYMVADAHLDTQWNWDIQTTIREYVWNTINQNLFLLEHNPNYIFNFEGGVKYAMMKEYYPLQYELMKKYIAQGRWHISGSSWEASDAIIPSPEAFIRNILQGQTYYRQEFGKESTDIFLPDCFGFGWTLPTIASHCGLIGFSSQKLDWRNHNFYNGKSKHPFMIGLWQGVDGARIMLAHGYDYGRKWKDEDLSENKTLLDLSKRTPLNILYRYYGTGDTGGSPTQTSVMAVEKGIAGKGPLKIISATSDQLFKDFLPYKDHPELPVFDGELLMDVHGTGCYSSQAAMKLYNRQNENLGAMTEFAAVTAEWLNNDKYPSGEITESWRRFLFHQFHDDLTGTSIPRAYEFSWNDELLSLKQFSNILENSIASVASRMNTKVSGVPVLLYNTHSYSVTDWVEAEVTFPKNVKGVSVYNENGKKVSSQVVSIDGNKAKVMFLATVPSMGYNVYDFRSGSSEKNVANSETTTLENSVYTITFNQYGDITSIKDKRNSKELVESGKAVRLAMFTENESFAWPAWEILKSTLDKEPVSITENATVKLVENGAYRKTVCVEKKYGDSHFKQYISLYEGENSDRIDFKNEIDWRSTNSLLKAEFPLTVSNPEATYDLGIGSVKRGNNVETAYEVYAQTWADLTDKDNKYGVSVLSESKYGWDKPKDNTIRLTLIHTPKTNRGYSYQDHQDLGYHTFTYSFIGHDGALNQSEITKRGDILKQPVLAFQTVAHKGDLGKSFSFVSCDNNSVSMKSIKKAEVSDEYVIRLFETSGVSDQKATLTFASELTQVCEADGTEKTLSNIPFSGKSFTVTVPKNSIKTLKFKINSTPNVVTASTYSLPLKYNVKATSWNELRNEGRFESGYSYAAELFPDSLFVDNVPFSLGGKDEPNALLCKGDTIFLPAGNTFETLNILAASTSQDVEAEFDFGKSKSSVMVPYYSGFIGQWGHEGHTVGYLKDATVAFVGTHRHNSQGDQPYEFTYMFKFSMPVPKKATYVILPNNDNVAIFSATLSNQKYADVTPAVGLYRTSIKESESQQAVAKKNILTEDMICGYSSFVNRREAPKFLVDGDLKTKWCDVEFSPSFVEFDLKETKSISGWKLVNAGIEDNSYVTDACFLQYRNSTDEPWKTIRSVQHNRRNVIVDNFNPVQARYIRLLVTTPTQNGNNATRINELEIY